MLTFDDGTQETANACMEETVERLRVRGWECLSIGRLAIGMHSDSEAAGGCLITRSMCVVAPMQSGVTRSVPRSRYGWLQEIPLPMRVNCRNGDC